MKIQGVQPGILANTCAHKGIKHNKIQRVKLEGWVFIPMVSYTTENLLLLVSLFLLSLYGDGLHNFHISLDILFQIGETVLAGEQQL